MCLEIDDSM